MLNRLKALQRQYPSQFWLLIVGVLISTIGASMIWPFLTVYVKGRLNLPLTQVATLLTLNAFMGLAFSFVAGPIIDRTGRKGVMVLSLAVNGAIYLFMSGADTYLAFALLLSLSGAFNPLYRVGADAMMADMIPPERRPDAYSILRTSNNLGIALGPALGGLIASTSYNLAFYLAAAGMLAFSLLMLFFGRETLPQAAAAAPRQRFGGYGIVLRDKKYVWFVIITAMAVMPATLVWMLLAVYAKENYQLSERLYGFIPTTNAMMVVLFQYMVTQVTKRRSPLPTLAVGSLLYALGVGSVALMHGFWGFWLSMVILTLGELVLVPTATTFIANLAPPDMRGRYMSLYSMTWPVAAGIGPILGGFLNDNISPVAIWYGGLLIGLLATTGYYMLARRYPQVNPPSAVETVA
jgi:MFS family permease